MDLKNKRGQTLLEYILLVVMIAFTVAIIIRNSNLNILRLWTALGMAVARPCPTCENPQPPPNLENNQGQTGPGD